MARKTARKSHSELPVLPQVAGMFRYEDTVRDRIALQGWPEEPHYPKYGLVNV